jgi:hypothetical protein
MEESFQSIIDVQEQYDGLHDTIDGYIDQVKKSATAEKKAGADIAQVHDKTSQSIVAGQG